MFEAHASRLGVRVPPDSLLNNLPHLESRLLSLRLAPDRHPAVEDRRGALLRRSLAAAWRTRRLSPFERLAWAGYLAFAGVAPAGMVRQVVRRTRGAGARSRWARLLLRLARLRHPWPAAMSLPVA